MPVFEVQLKYDFSPGNVDGSTEDRPDYLLGEDGRPFSLAVWPEKPLLVDASDEEAAVERAQRKQAVAGSIYIDSRLGEVRFKALRTHPKPGSGGKHSSVDEIWVARRQGDKAWHLTALTTSWDDAAVK
jgi:hypothetical protein